MEKGRSVTLKHLLIQERRYIGLQFNTDKVIHALVKQLPDVKWSNTYNMAYILNTKQNLDEIFKIFNFLIETLPKNITRQSILHGLEKGSFHQHIVFAL